MGVQAVDPKWNFGIKIKVGLNLSYAELFIILDCFKWLSYKNYLQQESQDYFSLIKKRKKYCLETFRGQLSDP
jgi:hypothetical protein